MKIVDLLRRLFYIRYPVMCLLALFLVGPVAALTSARELLANTLLIHTFWQALALTVISLTAARLFLVQAGVILFNGPARFSELLPAPSELAPAASTRLQIRWGWSTGKTLCWLATALTLPVTAVWYSATTRASASELGGFDNSVDWTTGLAGVAVGVLVDLCLQLVIAFVERRLVSASVTIPGLLPIRVDFPSPPGPRLWAFDRLLAQIVRGPGYTDPPDADGEIYCRPGHWQQLVVLGFVIAASIGLRALTAGSTARPEPPLLPTLFFAVLGLALISTVLAGASFFLDYFRIPALLVLVLALALSFASSGRDYTFATPKTTAGIDPPKLLDVVGAKDRSIPADKSGKRTLVVVTAPGGGIHAAAWTAQVLTGLHYRYGADYARSLFLISAVSGGSVGTMYYLDAWGRGDGTTFAPSALAEDPKTGHPFEGSIRANAQASSLEAAAWGVAYPDLMRVLFPPLVSRVDDRGWRIEDDWAQRLHDPGVTLEAWGRRMAAGQMPIAVFNSTIAETGQRMLFSPVLSRPRQGPPTATQARELRELYGTYDLRVSTAARLSATFPFISPICRPLESDDPNDNYHFCDGGYVDREGMVTVIDWLRMLLALPQEQRRKLFDRVLIVRILPFPTVTAPAPARVNSGWTYATLGPIDALVQVRSAGQAERNSLAVDTLVALAGSLRVRVEQARFVFETDARVPLSWMLTRQEQARIHTIWRAIETRTHPEDPLGVIDQLFQRQPGP